MSRHRFLLLTLVLATVFATISPRLASAVQPSFTRITPTGFQRGTELEVQFTGARLGDVEELMFYSPGISVVELKAAADNNVKAKLKIAHDCRLGIHAVRVRTKTGMSNLRTFCVGALPEVKEVEPNSDFDAPQTIPLGSTVSGVVQNEDVDHYVVEAKKGQRISAELEGLRLGITFFDPYLAILNSERFELARSDDAALLYQDCLCSIVAPADGKYVIQVRESAYGGNGNCRYRLHVGSFPRPTGVIPAGGKPGEVIDVKWIGDAAGNKVEKITIPTTATGLVEGLFAKDATGIAPSPNVVRINDLTNAVEVEPNDAREQATPASAPGALNGIIEKPGDVDYFKFTAKKGQRYDIRVYARKPLRSPLDSMLYVQRSSGANVASNDDSGGPDSYVRFTAPIDDEYRVMIRDHLNSGGPNFTYRIEIAPIKPKLTMVLPEKTRYVSTVLSVPQGNRVALMVSASRANFGGELDINVEGMPAGMTLQANKMAANQTIIPVLFSAAADAKTGGALADLVGRTTDEKLKVEGHINQRTLLIRGQNNRDVWGHNADRMAIALAEKVPFKIEIVQPKVPIVRNGSMGLKIVATRDEGFTAAISVRLLYNPSGIGSSRSISIPAGKNEAIIPLTANSGAAIKKWPIIVTGFSRVGNGTVEVATQMAELDVADRYFDLAIQKSAVEQGQETEIVVKVTKKQDFAGQAETRLLGLPAGIVGPTEPIKITKDSTEIVFKLKADVKARPGIFKSIVCRAVFMQNGEPITTTLGGGHLRIDKPLPPKVTATPKPKPVAVKPTVVVKKPPQKKRLSRLEQLRLDREKERQAAKK